jgi:predicted CXXCH cytochrome family protein
MGTMKRIVIAAALVALATSAYANGPFTNKAKAGVANTKHDIPLQITGTGATDMLQKCIFCHTPHNPRVDVPLWNRNASSMTFTMYNSPTLSSAARAAAIGTTTISAMCMSCHDGVTAMGNIKNTTLGAQYSGIPNDAAIGTSSSANLLADGVSLTNDHPVAFDYNAAAGEDAGLAATATANAALGGGAFFGTGLGFGNQMECASCHKVHDDRISPFLRMSNDQSQLCMACHINK